MSIAALGTLVWRHPLADVAGQGRGADRRRLHADLPDHRLALGPADVGHLLGVGRAADIGLHAVPDVSRRDRALAHDRRAVARRARGCDPHARRRRSTFRSSNSRSTGGTRCISRRRCCGWAARPSIPASCSPLLVMAIAFTLLFITLHLAAMRNEILRAPRALHADDAGASRARTIAES